jgi:hypothetical protein
MRAHRQATHAQPKLVAGLTGKAEEKGTLRAHATLNERVAALRAYLQSQHPGDDVAAMLKGCRSELNF